MYEKIVFRTTLWGCFMNNDDIFFLFYGCKDKISAAISKKTPSLRRGSLMGKMLA